jgi:hypothetical protein
MNLRRWSDSLLTSLEDHPKSVTLPTFEVSKELQRSSRTLSQILKSNRRLQDNWRTCERLVRLFTRPDSRYISRKVEDQRTRLTLAAIQITYRIANNLEDVWRIQSKE